MKYHALFVNFEKVAKFAIVMQIIGGTLRVNTKQWCSLLMGVI